jgi:nucleoside 2-deoxyribosyltransferase
MPGPRCYVASPLGFTESGRWYYRDVYLPALEKVVQPVDPWQLVDEADVQRALAQGHARELAADIARRNTEALNSCALLAAYLDGQEVDSGTAAEIGYAVARGLVCFGMRTDLRRAGDLGARVNLQVEGFIVASGGRIVGSLDELVGAISGQASRVDRP